MSNFEFIDYKATPGEKHIAIVSIKAYGKILLRFKMVPTKDGTGYWPASSRLKLVDSQGQDAYLDCFTIDSRIDHEQMIDFVKQCFLKNQKAGKPSIFDASENSVSQFKQQSYGTIPVEEKLPF